jgi:hypothetical protein
MKRKIPCSSKGKANARKRWTPNLPLPNLQSRAIPGPRLPKTRNSTSPRFQNYLARNHLSERGHHPRKALQAKPRRASLKPNPKHPLPLIKYPLRSLLSLNLRLERSVLNPPMELSKRVIKRGWANLRLKDLPPTRPLPRLRSQSLSLRGELPLLIELLRRLLLL